MAGSAATPHEGTVGLSRDGAIATVTLDNEPRLNAVSSAMWRQIAEVFGALGRDAAFCSIVLRGAGNHSFASGADVCPDVGAFLATSKPDFIGR